MPLGFHFTRSFSSGNSGCFIRMCPIACAGPLSSGSCTRKVFAFLSRVAVPKPYRGELFARELTCLPRASSGGHTDRMDLSCSVSGKRLLLPNPHEGTVLRVDSLMPSIVYFPGPTLRGVCGCDPRIGVLVDIVYASGHFSVAGKFGWYATGPGEMSPKFACGLCFRIIAFLLQSRASVPNRNVFGCPNLMACESRFPSMRSTEESGYCARISTRWGEVPKLCFGPWPVMSGSL